jgi:hypothetical protein
MRSISELQDKFKKKTTENGDKFTVKYDTHPRTHSSVESLGVFRSGCKTIKFN